MRPEKYLKYLIEPIFNTRRTKEIFNYNPATEPVREEATHTKIFVYNYDPASISAKELKDMSEVFIYRDSDKVSWINMDGIVKANVEAVCQHFEVHPLLIEDILSIGQRPKMDDIEGVMFCQLNMLYFNNEHCSVEQEQISIALGKNFVLTFQEDEHRDVFNNIREKLKVPSSRLRQRGADYLCYSLVDMIVDHYFEVIEKLGEKIEALEEEIIRINNKRSLAKLNALRKEMIVLKKNVGPVRELVNGFIKSESDLLDDKVNKYYKDAYDHIVQANEVAENYREILASLQDLYINQVNLRMNEVMKVMAIVTCLLAPATVIGGIFGMNFDVIPYAHQAWGFYITVAVMLVVPLIMLRVFKKRGWF
ncbi:magnesium/cobalt transporter CorA [Segetibacter sp.]|jgi:magnesium transporter|uniref:magnesium/cobalt transporter CorA n=1 Tax=Segetibacter sp. TaxID=2231182 RepID=UPI00261C3AB3|nr:magnesium/cobalt transporter CorA [Segetibacter sp.]MCW3079991.1 corA [Segetibacter sp.]